MTQFNSSLKGQLALITGATQGIGLAIAHALAAEGCNLIVCGRDRTRLAKAESELSRDGSRALALTCDVRDENSVSAMFTEIRKHFTRLDILINNAGVANTFRPIGEITTTEWNEVLSTNLTGTFLVTRTALPLMSRGGSIVSVLS